MVKFGASRTTSWFLGSRPGVEPQNKEQFPNLEVMARQYLGCPATSASVERLFSKVCIAFSAKRKRSEAETLKNQMFANANL